MKPLVLWFTGLPAAGKTTLSNAFVSKYGALFKYKILDGDDIRNLYPGLGYSKKDRQEQIARVANMAAEYERSGHIVLVALVSPYQDARALAKSLCQTFYEIYVSTPLKNLY